VKTVRVAVFLAIRSVLRGNYGIASLTTLMMLVIYVSLLFLPSLIQGAVDRVNGLLISTVTSDIVITPASKSTSIGDVSRYLGKIRETAGVADATAVFHIGNQISYGSNSGTWSIDAIDPSSYRAVFATPSNIFEGHYLSANDTSQVFLGIAIAGAGQIRVRGYRASLKAVYANRQVELTFNNGQTSQFNVKGIFNNQFPLSDNNAFITMHEAEALVPAITDHATTIFVRTKPGARVGQVVDNLKPLQDGVQFQTSADLGSVVADQVATFTLISDILKVVSLMTAAITIFIITYVDLVNKRRQIGIQRAIGIKSAPIVMSYVLKAWGFAAVGIGTGFLLFRYVATPFVRGHPFHFPNGPVTLVTTGQEVIQDVVILVVVASIAALIPALRSVHLRILDAIWGN